MKFRLIFLKIVDFNSIFFISIFLSSCFQADLNWSSSSNQVSSVLAITSPSSGSTINDSNQSSFAVSGTCPTSAANVYIFVNSTYTAVAVCSGNTWSTSLNLSSLSYDSSVTISVGNSNAYSSSLKNQVYSKSFCSAPTYLTQATIPSGNGSSGSPYLICSGLQFYTKLNSQTSNWASYYKLMSDIDLSSYPNPVIGTSATAFSGNFNGNGHKISGITLTTGTVVGLFSYTQNATISNLTLNSPTISGGVTYAGSLIGQDTSPSSTALSSITVNSPSVISSATSSISLGGLVGYTFSASMTVSSIVINSPIVSSSSCISSCYVGGVFGTATTSTIFSQIQVLGGSISSSSNSTTTTVGGIFGWAQNAGISNCLSTATVSGGGTVGGIAGQATGTFQASYCGATGSVTSTASAFAYAGGLVGNGNGTISQSYFNGSVSSNCTGPTCIAGGLVGESWPSAALSISNSYSQGTVSNGGTSALSGGLIGYVSSASTVTLTNDYSACSEVGTNRAGLVAGSVTGTSTTFTNGYWDSQVGATSGVLGLGTTSGSYTAQTTAAMQTQGTFTGYDFATPLWKMPSSSGYPLVSWQ